MTIPRDQEWLTPDQVAVAFNRKREWVYDQIKAGRSNRTGTTGIPARMVRRVGGTIHIHRQFVFPAELQQPANVVALPPSPPVIDEAALARAFVDELIARLVSGEAARRSA